MLKRSTLPSAIGYWTALFYHEDLVFLGSDYLGPEPLACEINKYIETHFSHVRNSIIDIASPSHWSWTHPPAIKLFGTPFQLKVWQALTFLAHDQLITYSELATQIGQPNAIRAVGSAVAKNPIAYWIPCHRVIHKQPKKIGYRWGHAFKEKVFHFEKSQNRLASD